MFYDEIVQTFICHTHPVQLVMLEKRWITLDDLFSYEKYISILENPSTITVLCKQWNIHLPCSSFHFFTVRWNMKHLLEKDVPLWYCVKYCPQFLLAPNPKDTVNEIRSKREDLNQYLISEGLLKNIKIQQKGLSPSRIYQDELFDHSGALRYINSFQTFEENICKYGYTKNLVRIPIYKKKYSKLFENQSSPNRNVMILSAINNIHGAEVLKFLNPTVEELQNLEDRLYEFERYHIDTIVYMVEKLNWKIKNQLFTIYLLAMGYEVEFAFEYKEQYYQEVSYVLLKECNPKAAKKLLGENYQYNCYQRCICDTNILK